MDKKAVSEIATDLGRDAVVSVDLGLGRQRFK
jgi:hypothetical protein